METMETSKATGRFGRGKRALRLALASALIAGGASVATGVGTAAAANGGTVMCVNQANVVGVWVEVSGGTSGWATRSGSGYYQRWSYNTQNKPYTLTVGCGGTPQKWASSSRTATASKTWTNVMCYPGGTWGVGTIYVKDRCYPG